MTTVHELFKDAKMYLNPCHYHFGKHLRNIGTKMQGTFSNFVDNFRLDSDFSFDIDHEISPPSADTPKND